jgi:hypothetical protein
MGSGRWSSWVGGGWFENQVCFNCGFFFFLFSLCPKSKRGIYPPLPCLMKHRRSLSSLRQKWENRITHRGSSRRGYHVRLGKSYAGYPITRGWVQTSVRTNPRTLRMYVLCIPTYQQTIRAFVCSLFLPPCYSPGGNNPQRRADGTWEQGNARCCRVYMDWGKRWMVVGGSIRCRCSTYACDWIRSEQSR